MGRFGWNENPAADFCIEVDVIEGMEADYRAGLETKRAVEDRIFRAMQFSVGGDERAVEAKNNLRRIEAALVR